MSVCGQVSSWDGTRYCFMEMLMYAQDIPEDWKHKHNLCTHVWIYISKVSVSYSTLHVHSVIYKPVVLVMLQDICRLVWKVAWEYWCLSNLIEMYSSPWQQFLVQVQHKQWASRIVEGGLGWTAMLRWCQLLHV